MKRSTFIATAAAGLLAITATAGTGVMAQNTSSQGDAAELAQFVTANPQLASVIAELEAQSGGTVIEAEFDHETGDGATQVEFEVALPDGLEAEYLFDSVTGTMTLEDEDADDDSDEDDDNEEDDN